MEEAKSFLENEQYDKAIKKFDDILMLREGHIEALNGKGVALCKQKKYEEALECFKEVLKIKPKHAEASVYVDMISDRIRISKEYNAEEKPSDKVAKQQAELEKRTEEKVIKALDESKQLTTEVSQYRPKRVSGADPRNPYNDPTLPYFRPNLGKKDESSQYVQRLTEQYHDEYDSDTGLTTSYRNDANALYNEGFALHNSQRYNEAIAYYDKALELDPKLKNAWANKAIILLMIRGEYEEATQCFDKALEVDPNFGFAWYWKGTSVKNLGDEQLAEKCYMMAAQLGYYY
jgi:tetratricopeptide (TPR) repeat protein